MSIRPAATSLAASGCTRSTARRATSRRGRGGPSPESGEAVRVGPGAMPRFATLSDQDIDDLAAYILNMQGRNTTAPEDFGGVGPVAEGLAAWLLALLPIIAPTRWIGRPREGRDAPVDETAEAPS